MAAIDAECWLEANLSDHMTRRGVFFPGACGADVLRTSAIMNTCVDRPAISLVRPMAAPTVAASSDRGSRPADAR
jgi:hypothetical protein